MNLRSLRWSTALAAASLVVAGGVAIAQSTDGPSSTGQGRAGTEAAVDMNSPSTATAPDSSTSSTTPSTSSDSTLATQADRN